MGSAKYIGRVGALAVALGVGTAVTSGYGIASAEPDTNSSHSGVASPRPRSAGAADRRGTRAPTRPAATERVRSSGGQQDTDLPQITALLGSDPSPASAVPGAVRQPLPKPVALARTAQPRPVALASPIQQLPAPALSPSPVPVAPTAAAPPQAPVAAVPRLLSTLSLTPTSNPLPGRVPENPLAAALLGWVRRLEKTFLNKAPTTDYNANQNVQVDATHVVGYLDPTDRDGDALTYTSTSANGGTATFDPTTPGKFTYTAPDSWDGTTEWTDTVTVAVSDEGAGWHVHGLLGLFGLGRNHTTSQTVSITVAPLTDPSVDAADGTIDGTVPADNATLTYRLDAESVDLDLGAVTLDSETGQWTFTPSLAARTDTAGPVRTSFTILAQDGEHVTPITVTAPIVRAGGVITVPLPEGATPSGGLVATEDGSLIQASYDPDKKQSYLTVIDASGKARTSAPLPGAVVGEPLPGKGGAVYQQTYDEYAETTYLNVVEPDGTTVNTAVPGRVEGGIVVGPTGAAYLTSVRDNAPVAAVAAFSAGARSAAAMQVPSPGSTTYITVAKAGGGTVTFGPIPGVTAGELAFAPDGTAYQTTYTYDQATGVARTYVTVIAADAGSIQTTAPIDGIPQGQLRVGANGTGYQAGFGIDPGTGAAGAYMTAIDPDGTARRLFTVPGMGRALLTGADGTSYLLTYSSADDQSFVTALSPAEVVTVSTPIPGDPMGSPALRSDGAVLQTTARFTPGTGWESFLTVIGADGQGVTTALPSANTYGGVVLGPDGVAYQPSIDYAAGQSYVTVVKPDDSVANSTPIPGTPTNEESFSVSPAGAAHLVTDAYDPVAGHQTYLTTIDSAATVTVSDPLPGSPIAGGTLFGSDGTVYQVTDAYDGSGHTSYVTVFSTDGAVRTTALPGEAMQHAGVIDPAGVVYVTSVDYSAGGRTFLTAVGADGSTRSTYGFTGTPANDGLVLGPDGKVYLTTYAADAGTGAFQTFVFAVDSDASVLSSAPLPGDPPQGVVFGPGGTLYQATSVGTFVLNTSGWQVHRAPAAGSPAFTVLATDPSSGAVSGTVNVTDADGDQLSYQLDPSGPPTVVIDSGSGAWVFTPTAEQRAAAYYGSGPDRVSFDVIVTDGEYRSVVTVSAAIDPSRGAAIAVPTGASPAGPLVVGSDGTAYLASRDTTTNQTYVTVIGADGTVFTSDPLPGSVIGSVVPRSGGGAVLLTSDGTTSYLGVIDPDGTASATALPGQSLGPLAVAPDGTVYQTTFVRTVTPDGGPSGGGPGGAGGNGSGGSGGGPGGSGTETVETFVGVAGVDGDVRISLAIPGLPQDPIRFAPDGTAYQTSFVRDTSTNTTQTYVTVVGTDGSLNRTGPLSGDAAGSVVFAPDGTAYQATYEYSGPTTISVIGTGGVTSSTQLPGQPTGEPLVRPDGTLVQTTYDGVTEQTYVSFVDTTGVVTDSNSFAASPVNGPVVDSTGTVYQTLNVFGPGGGVPQSSVAAIGTDGTPTVVPLTGAALVSGIQLGNDGRAYQITNTAFPGTGPNSTYVTTIDPDGTAHSTQALPGVAVEGTYHVTAGGSVYLTTRTDTQTYVTVTGDDGVSQVTEVPGSPTYLGIAVGADGSVYQSTTDTVTRVTYLTVIAPDGTVRTGIPMRGTPAYAGLIVAPDGAVYQTTYTVVDPVTGASATIIGAVDNTGNIRTSQPISGDPAGGVAIGADGTLYQTTSAVSAILDPSSWKYDRSPVADNPAFAVVSVRPVNGKVSGTLAVGDPDGDPLSYRVAPDAGDVVVDLNTGAWTFTPTAAQREAAFYGTGPSDATFTILVDDGLATTAVVVVAPIDAVAGDRIPLPQNAAPNTPVAFGPDGTGYQSSYDPAADTTYVTVVNADGSANTAALSGNAVGQLVTGLGGLAYQTTSGGEGSYLNIIAADGTVTSVSLAGDATSGPVRGPNGVVYQLSSVAPVQTFTFAAFAEPAAPASEPGIYVTVVDNNGQVHTVGPLQGTPADQGLVFGPDGTGYLTTGVYDGYTGNGQTYVTVIGADGVAHTTDVLAGNPSGAPVFAPDGTTYQATYEGIVGPSHIFVVAEDGTVAASADLTGQAVGQPVIRPDGSVYQVTFRPDTQSTSLNALDKTGDIVVVGTFTGQPRNPVIDSGGTLYVALSSGGGGGRPPTQTSVAVINPDGTATVATIPGMAIGAGRIGADGRVYFSTFYFVPRSPAGAYVVGMNPDGTFEQSALLPGSPVVGTDWVAPDGTIYLTTSDGTTTYVTATAANNVSQSTQVPGGQASDGITRGIDGRAYQTTYDYDAQITYVTAVSPDGVIRTGAPVAGLPVDSGMVVGAMGTVYLTTGATDPVTGDSFTYVGVVGPDGSVGSPVQLLGSPVGGAVVAPNGAVYQTTSTGSYEVYAWSEGA